MNPPLRFFVWNQVDKVLYKPDQVESISFRRNELAISVMHDSHTKMVCEDPIYGQSAGVNDSQGNELFAGAVTVQTYDPYPSAVVKFIDGGFVFVYKIGNQTMQCSISALHKHMVLVGHQWMDPAELKRRIAQAKRKWVSV